MCHPHGADKGPKQGKNLPQALQLINAGPSFESCQGSTEVTVCTNQCSLLPPALTLSVCTGPSTMRTLYSNSERRSEGL